MMATATATPETKTYTMLSAPMMNAPGVLRWAINGYKFKRDRAAMLRVVKCWEGPSDEVYHRLLMGEIEWREVDGNVEFTVEVE